MSSQQIAIYLYEVGSSQRKLEYCRQILAANPNFTPSAIFNHATVQPRNSITRSEFGELLKVLGISSTAQEVQLIFSYFQIDAKNYLTLQEFSSLIAPQADPALKSLISKRRGQSLEIDYSIRYALQKFFGQVVENQVRLELLCKFTFEKEREERSKFKRANSQTIKQFLAFHGKYPADTEVTLILKEVGLSKGDSKRNKLIAEYTLSFIDKKRTNQEPPKVYQRQPTAIVDFRTKYQSIIQQQQTIAINKVQSTLKPKPQIPQLYPKHSLLQSSQNHPQVLAARTNQFASTISNVSQVQERIKSLMGSIHLKPSFQKQEQDQSKHLPLDSAKHKQPSKSVKEQIKRQKESQKSASHSICKRLDFKDKDTIIKDIYSIDNKSERRELTQRPKSNYQFETYTDRNKTDRFLNRNKRITEDNFENESNNSNSQLQIQKRTNKRPVVEKYSESESKKRIEYLKSLVDKKENI